MALWSIEKKDGLVKLMYTERADTTPRDCGSGEEKLEQALFEWVAVSAATYDLVRMPDGRVCQVQKEVPGRE